MKIKLKCPTCDYRTEYEIEDPKLEAVKKWVEKHGDSVGMYQANWDELDKILESSLFKEE